MLGGSSDSAWEKYGEIDPYFGVCVDEKYRNASLGEDAYAEFFKSGEDYIDVILETVRRHVQEGFQPTQAMDFGCGVGRLVLPLARVCERVVGVDISDSMLREARKNCDERSLANVELVRSDDRLLNVAGTFDFIHSVIVFQHIPPERGIMILRAMIDRLAENGVAALHFTYARRASLARRAVHAMRKKVPLVNGLVNVVQGRPLRYPLMQMNNYSLNRIFAVLQETGCQHSYLRFTDHGGHLGVVLFFQKKAFPSL